MDRFAYLFVFVLFFSDLIVKVIQQNMGGIKIEEWRKVRSTWERLAEITKNTVHHITSVHVDITQTSHCT